MVDRAAEGASVPSQHKPTQAHRTRLALSYAKPHLQRSALRLAAYLLIAYLVLKLIPALENAFNNLEHASWPWLFGALALETISEMGFVVSWGAIVDPDSLLTADGRGQRMDTRVAWAQLGGGTLVPGGSYGGLGVGAWFLHRLGMPSKLVAEREFNLSFLNTAVDALALIVFGLALASGVLTGPRDLLLTLLPAAVAAAAITAAVLIAHRAATHVERKPVKHARIAVAVATLARAVEDTRRLLFHRGSYTAVLGAFVYLVFDLLVLWSAFIAIHAHPLPSFAVVVMAYIIGALGSSIPLPAGIGTIGGIVGAFILYGVQHNAALAAVLLYQAIALLVPLAGGGLAYTILRGQLGRMAKGISERPG
jgi:Lysylphosphatidylglycerol synthase TM region